jgi:PAS domain S-box-containing protein
MAAHPAGREGIEPEQRYERLLAAVTDYVFHVRVADGRAVETVHASNCEAVTGYTPQEFADNPLLWIAMVPPEDRAVVEQQAACILSGQDAAPIEHRILRKDGRLRWVQNTVCPQRDDQGQLIAYDGLLRDVTERTEAEQKLRESEEFGRQVVGGLQEGLIVFDRDLRYRGWNRFMEQLSGLTAEQVLGRHPDELSPWLRERGILAGVERALGGESLVHPDVRTHDAGAGREIWLAGRSTPLRDAQGNIIGVITTLQDITKRKQAEEALRQRNESERKELQQHLLEIASEEQRRIGQELHDGIAQELTGLGFFAATLCETLELLARKEMEGETTWVLDEANVLRLRQAASRLSRGLEEANRHVQDLSHGIMPVQIDTEGLMSALQELAATIDGQQQVTCRFECHEPVAVADNNTATHLYRIAQEALNNACRHGQADQIHILLSQEDDRIVLEVRDNGIGFDPVAKHPGGPAGRGLRTMDYRAGIIGGVLHVGRRAEGGTLVRCTVLQGADPHD